MKLKVVDDNRADAGVYQEGFDTTTLTLTAPLGGDANQDGSVDVSDLAILAANYGRTTTGWWRAADFNDDGVVNVLDLAILAATLPANQWRAEPRARRKRCSACPR